MWQPHAVWKWRLGHARHLSDRPGESLPRAGLTISLTGGVGILPMFGEGFRVLLSEIYAVGIIHIAGLAQLGERQTEAHFNHTVHLKVMCSIHTNRNSFIFATPTLSATLFREATTTGRSTTQVSVSYLLFGIFLLKEGQKTVIRMFKEVILAVAFGLVGYSFNSSLTYQGSCSRMFT